MKKTALVLLLAGITAGAGAQTVYDALTFSESNYEGTARTMAMGNAFTALGGDLGAVTINPAGSAVANYGQITITPALNISVNNAGGTAYTGESTPYSFGNRLRNAETRFSVPNFGVTMNLDLHRSKGLKNINIGFIVNTTNRYQQSLITSGEHSNTSFAGSEAYWASIEGYDMNSLLGEDAYNSYNAPWKTIVAAQSGMLSELTDYPGIFVGATENFDVSEGEDGTNINAWTPGPLFQTYQRQNTGYKYDYVFNIGFNISDFVYFGANLGITSLNYDSALRFTEAAVDPSLFENSFTDNDSGQETVTYFDNLQYDYRYSARGTGVYGKFGFIVNPGFGLRIGAALQTPTSTHIKENWSESGATVFTDSQFNASSESPLGEYEYRLVSPLRANFGLAYTFGTFGLISVDYELCDYSTMKFKEKGMQSGTFDDTNMGIKSNMGMAHELRAGIEIKPLAQLALRAGYGFTTSPEKVSDEFGKMVYVSSVTDHPGRTMTHKGAFGIGYSTKGSFFIDAACSFTKFRDEYIYPYDDYCFDGDGYVREGHYTPEILNRRMLWNVLLTFGFRF